MSEEESSTLEMFKALAPFLAGTVLVAVFVTLLMLRFLPGAAASTGSVVSFDVIKYTNAQRAVASAFLKREGDSSEASALLLNLPDRTREAIRDVAGANTLVVVKQSVVQGTTVDITDAVLKKLGLPSNVPTSDSVQSSLNYAPTMLQTPPSERMPRPIPGENGGAGSDKVLP